MTELGAPPVTLNQDPRLTGEKATLADGLQNNTYTSIQDKLLQGFSEPEDDFVSI